MWCVTKRQVIFNHIYVQCTIVNWYKKYLPSGDLVGFYGMCTLRQVDQGKYIDTSRTSGIIQILRFLTLFLSAPLVLGLYQENIALSIDNFI